MRKRGRTIPPLGLLMVDVKEAAAMQSHLDCLHWFGTPVYVFGSINDPIFRVGDIFVALGYHHHLSVPYTVGDLNGRGHLYRVRRADFGNGRCNQYYGLDKTRTGSGNNRADAEPCRSQL